MGDWKGKHFYAWAHFTRDKTMADFFDIQAKIDSKKRARKNGGFLWGHNTRINIYQARWPHRDGLIETYAVKYHSTEILYLCADATASYSFHHDDGRTTRGRLAQFQATGRSGGRPHWDEGPKFFAGQLQMGHARITDLPRHAFLNPPDLRETVVVEYTKIPVIWLPDGRRFWVRTDDKSTTNLVLEHLARMIEYAEPFTHSVSQEHLNKITNRSYRSLEASRLGRAIAASRDGNMRKALAGLVWKLDRKFYTKETGLHDMVVQLLMGLASAQHIQKKMANLGAAARRDIGITHLQNVDTGERVYGELDKPAPDSWLVPLLYATPKAMTGVEKELELAE